MSNPHSPEPELGACMHGTVIMGLVAEMTAAINVIFLEGASAWLK